MALTLLVALITCSSLAEGAQGAADRAGAQAPQATLRGWLTVTWGDGEPGSGRSAMLFHLTDDQGKSSPVQLPEALLRQHGGLQGLDRQRVVLRGQWVSRGGFARPVLQA